MKKKKGLTYVERHLRLVGPSIQKIKIICEECIDHGLTWYEFKTRIDETMRNENRFIQTMEGV